MAEELEKAHLYYDDINMVRVLDAAVIRQTTELHDRCGDYTNSFDEFIQIFDSLMAMQTELVENVERQKMAAIGASNLLKSIAKERESQQAKLQAEISEKSLLLEQLDAEFDSLQLVEATQQETIEYLTQMK